MENTSLGMRRAMTRQDTDAKSAQDTKDANDAATAAQPGEVDPTAAKEVEYDVDKADAVLTKLQTPEWIEMILAVTRISELQYNIEIERAERAKESYINPYQEVYQLVTSIRFEATIATAIIINCMIIGMQASWEPDPSNQAFFSFAEHFFVVFFFGEWCLRMRAFGWVWIFELPNAADSFLVFGTGVIPKWVLEPAGVKVGAIRVVTVLRALRLARVVRAVRLTPQFRELWMLIQGMVQSFRPLLWTVVIMVIIHYVFGIMATQIIGNVWLDDDTSQELFGDLLKSMFTLFQLTTTSDYCYTVVRPMMDKSESSRWSLCLFFLVFLFLVLFVVLNLVSAIIVENAMSIAQEDTVQKVKALEAEKKQELKVLADLFLEIDKDGSGTLTNAEFIGALNHKKVQQMLTLLELQARDMAEIWDVLDDGDGTLTIKEFTTGLRRMKGEAKAKDIIEVVKRLRHTSFQQSEISTQISQLGDTVTGLEKDVERLSHDTGEIVGLFQEMCLRLQAYVEKGEAQDRVDAVKAAEAKFLEDQLMVFTGSKPGWN